MLPHSPSAPASITRQFPRHVNIFWRGACLLTFGFFASCATQTPASASSTSREPKGEWKDYQKGKASWYGGRFHGGKTANGERYDQNSMTAAHKKLPFGTKVKVTNPSNGRSCIVRINNRGPFTKGRIIDLSAAAAKVLDIQRRGVAPVAIEVQK